MEGPNDFAALHSLSLRLFDEQKKTLPTTRRVAIINAGATGGGGYANVLKLAGAAKEIGLRAVGAIDGDIGPDAQNHLMDYWTLPSVVVRLPDDKAIEAAIIDDIPEEVLRQAIKDMAAAADRPEPGNLDNLSSLQLQKSAMQFIKRNSLHGQFIDTLPAENLPVLACQYLEKLIQVATGTETGLVQL